MRCTNCSREVKPVVAIDIDGTLGDFHTHFLKFAAMYTASTIPMNYGGDVGFKRWFLDNCSYEDENTWQQIKLAYRQGGLKRSMPIYDGAERLCRVLREEGAELWLTTTRPYLRLDNVDPDTRFWLELNGIKYDGLLYDEDKYAKLAEYVDKERVVAVLDDLPEQWEEAAKAFGWRVPILRRTRWNRKVPSDSAIMNLEKALSIIYERMRAWKGAHRER